jgi:nicotinate-nucleotide pyrophosphorylase (carboxylating)
MALDPAEYRDLVRRALAEDIGAGDITTAATVPPSARGHGRLLAKAPCVVAGLDLAIDVFRQLDPNVDVRRHLGDGDSCAAGETMAEVAGRAHILLAGERTALNFLQRLCGIATRTRDFVSAAAGRLVVLDTRKTTPTLRAVEKYAVRVGGGTNHRHGLFDAVLIKDNHVALAGGVGPAVAKARAAWPRLQIEVEARTLGEVEQAVAANADVVLLDNFATGEIREAVARVGGRAKIEISGGVTLDRLSELASTGADFVSVGALTHSAPAIDISFEITRL